MRSTRFAIAALPLLVTAVPALAQPTVGPLREGFGTAVSYSSVSGEVDAGIYGQTPEAPCSGFVGVQPSHRIAVLADFADMHVRVDSYGLAASLVVYGPNGRRCSGIPTINPELAGPWPTGTYNVFVGAQTQYGWVSYDLLVGETPAALERLAAERAGLVGGTIGDVSMFGAVEDPGLWGEVTGGLGISGVGLGEGVDPSVLDVDLEVTPPPADPTVAAAERPVARETIAIDPSAITALVYDGSVGQEAAASALAPEAAACDGWVGINPDFGIRVVAPTESLLLELDVPTGASLVRYGPVGDPAATWACASTMGTPARLGGAWTAGTYLVWLGSTGGPGAYLFTVASAP